MFPVRVPQARATRVRRPRCRSRSAVALLAGLLAASAAVAQSPLRSAVQSKDGELAIVAGLHGPKVTNRKGWAVPLIVPDEVRIQSLTPIRSGWIAAGDQPVGGHRDLYLRLLDAGGLKRLPTPAFQEYPLRTAPLVLSRDGRVEGLVWLEGWNRDALRVRASRWLGITWSRPMEITVEGAPGALALDATQLADGSWLLVWAGFDGEDDEIYTSLVIGESFTEPVPLTANDVPDIVPTVAAVGEHTLLAWNQYDGEEYRVVVSRLVEGRWSEPRPEPAGTFDPLFTLQDGVPSLLFLSLGETGGVWHLHEIGPEGEIVRRGSVPAISNQRPLVRTIDGEARLEWAGGVDRRPVAWEADS